MTPQHLALTIGCLLVAVPVVLLVLGALILLILVL